jgi:hypothetical protein
MTDRVLANAHVPRDPGSRAVVGVKKVPSETGVGTLRTIPLTFVVFMTSEFGWCSTNEDRAMYRKLLWWK